ncbi:hypothetical protein BurJ1DRAFT_1942 [Burkholderiales bacterium JOSHI_001]|nr:hypothetical protein BurJ1DRAFT_1848 [Burkholderiales bacterium JOSHI_001]EHR70789.1 hypothetical protein BurJ1DRAFT_1942 [Burkholderiales bacterium JOSHI_001]
MPRSILALVIASFACIQSAAHAQGSTFIEYAHSGPFFGGLPVIVTDPVAPVSGSFASFGGTSELQASAEFGRLRVLANEHVPPSVSRLGDNWSGLYVRSSWSDAITLSNDALTGQLGHVTVALNYTWSLSLTDPSPVGSQAQSDIKLMATSGGLLYFSEIGDALTPDCPSGVCAITRNAVLVNSSGRTPVTPGPGSLQLEFAFIFGVPFDLTATLTSYAYAYGSLTASGDAAADSSHTALWGGILSVQDDYGAAVPYSAVSSSGFDYTTAVPEVDTAALLLIGLVGLGVVHRRPGQCIASPLTYGSPSAA